MLFYPLQPEEGSSMFVWNADPLSTNLQGITIQKTATLSVSHTLGCVLCTYFLRKCPNLPVSGHHHFPSTSVVVTCSSDATSVIHCSSLSQWPASAQQLNVPLYQNPRNALHKIRNLQTENKKTTQVTLFLERIQFIYLFQIYISQHFHHPLFTLIFTLWTTLSHSNNWFQLLKSALCQWTHLAQISVETVQVFDVMSVNKMCSISHQPVHYVSIWIQGIQNREHSLHPNKSSF